MREHFEKFKQRVKTHPVLACSLFGLAIISDIAVELCKHRLCAWANERIDQGAGPVIKAIRDLSQAAIDHPWFVLVGLLLLMCGALVVCAVGAIWYESLMNRRQLRADEQKAKEASMELRLDLLEKSRKMVIPSAICLAQIIDLLRESDYCLERLACICTSYPDSAVAKRPLDRMWRLKSADELDEPTKWLGLSWANLLVNHVIRANDFFSSITSDGVKQNVFTKDTVILQRYVFMNETFMDQDQHKILMVLTKHQERLREIRDNYAATCMPEPQSITKS